MLVGATYEHGVLKSVQVENPGDRESFSAELLKNLHPRFAVLVGDLLTIKSDPPVTYRLSADVTPEGFRHGVRVPDPAAG